MILSHEIVLFAAFILELRGTVATKDSFCNVLDAQGLFVKPG